MKQKKYIKKHNFGEFNYEKELDKILNQYFSSHRYNVPVGNWVVVSPRVAEVLNNLGNENRG